jgi:small neutral amino acid transporter SnatA (MarC family)
MSSTGKNLYMIISSVLPFLAILNPFALYLYLAGVTDDLESRVFAKVLFWAALISLVVSGIKKLWVQT